MNILLVWIFRIFILSMIVLIFAFFTIGSFYSHSRTINNIEFILENFGNFHILVLINIGSIIFLYKNRRKYKYSFLIPILLIILQCAHVFWEAKLKEDSDVNMIQNFEQYKQSPSYQKYMNRVNYDEDVFQIQDSFLNPLDEKEAMNGKQSSIEHLFFLTRMQNSPYFMSPKLLPSNFYYQLCLFYKNNTCQHFDQYDGIYYKDPESKKVIIIKQGLSRDLMPWDLLYYPKPHNKEEIIKLDYFFGQYLNVNQFSCSLLFYGAQNGWDSYKNKLLEKLKKDNTCINEIFQEVDIVSLRRYPSERNYNKDLEDTNKFLINFLSSQKKKNDIDFQFENGDISLHELYILNQKDHTSIYNNLLLFFYESKELTPDREIIVQLEYIRKTNDLNKLLEKDKTEKLIEVIKYIKMPKEPRIGSNDESLNVGESRLIESQFELWQQLQKDRK